MTMPTVPPLPTQPEPTLDQQLTHLGLQMRVVEHAQRERSITVTGLLAEAMSRNADEAKRNADNLRALLDGGLPSDEALTTALQSLTQAISSAQPAQSGDGLTAGDVAIVKGIVDAVRPVQG